MAKLTVVLVVAAAGMAVLGAVVFAAIGARAHGQGFLANFSAAFVGLAIFFTSIGVGVFLGCHIASKRRWSVTTGAVVGGLTGIVVVMPILVALYGYLRLAFRAL